MLLAFLRRSEGAKLLTSSDLVWLDTPLRPDQRSDPHLYRRHPGGSFRICPKRFPICPRRPSTIQNTTSASTTATASNSSPKSPNPPSTSSSPTRLYFLSNGGITCHAGKMVSVHKGDWDKSRGADANHEFNFAWLSACQRVLKPNGSIWVSGTAHVIHSVGFAMQQLGFKLLNDITWVKPNPPPNLSCRYFTHATETLIWAAKNKKSRHTFHYKHMKEINRGKQMKSVWEIRPPESWEKKFGKHPTQKPVALLERILLASTSEGDLVLDPFAGAATTLIAALRLRRSALGCELSADFLSLSLRRICSNLVQVELSVSCVQFSVDQFTDPVDRSDRAPGSCRGRFLKRPFFDSSTARDSTLSLHLQLVQTERRFYFIGRTDRRVIFSVLANSLDEALQKFRASGHSSSDAFFIIKTETEIYLA